MVTVNHLTKYYGENKAVDDLSFTLEPCTVYGLLGANGAGKSTTMNMITGYIGVSSGTVVVDGHDILEEPEEAKKCIGYLPELPPLYLDMTVGEYLHFSAELKGIAKQQQENAVEQVLEMTKLKQVEHRLIANLSKGYKQRVGLAHAIMGLPDIIILDEPTVGLDPAQIIEIRDLIRKLGEHHTVILSSHILSEVSAVCEHIFIISNGKLVASDTPENLVKQHRSRNTIMLEVKKLPDVNAEGDTYSPSLQSALQQVEGIETIRLNNESETVTAIEIESDSSLDLRERIFYALADARITILKMNMEMKTLEDVFLELTAGETQNRRRENTKNKHVHHTRKQKNAEAENDAEKENAEVENDTEQKISDQEDK